MKAINESAARPYLALGGNAWLNKAIDRTKVKE